MSWQSVIVICVLSILAVVAGGFHLDQLAGVLAGIAGGLAVQHPAVLGSSSTVKSTLPVVGALLGGGLASLLMG